MEVTEKKDGKETTKKYAAKNADELKKDHAEAHKIYEKYSKGAGGRIQIQAFPAQPGRAIQIAPRAVPIMHVPIAKRGVAARLTQARRLIETTAKQLKGEDAGEQANKFAKRLEEIAKQLNEIEGELAKDDQ
ncbi:MAG: hypothetical protein H8E44_30525 [Planctomycetes bacterium]|nr:hypothetical protein [Planctomycetota bacterium]MBL7044097.1 hypothetical protein [Pirellulaceae bacterium]